MNHLNSIILIALLGFSSSTFSVRIKSKPKTKYNNDKENIINNNSIVPSFDFNNPNILNLDQPNINNDKPNKPPKTKKREKSISETTGINLTGISFSKNYQLRKNNNEWQLCTEDNIYIPLYHQSIAKEDILIFPNNQIYFNLNSNEALLILLKFENVHVKIQGFLFNTNTQEWVNYPLEEEPEEILERRFPASEDNYVYWNGIDQRKHYLLKTFIVSNKKINILIEPSTKQAFEIIFSIEKAFNNNKIIIPRILGSGPNIPIQSRCGRYIVAFYEKSIFIIDAHKQSTLFLSDLFPTNIVIANQNMYWFVNSRGELIAFEDRIYTLLNKRIDQNQIQTCNILESNEFTSTQIFLDKLNDFPSADMGLVHAKSCSSGRYLVLHNTIGLYDLKEKQPIYEDRTALITPEGILCTNLSGIPFMADKEGRIWCGDTLIASVPQYSSKNNKYFLNEKEADKELSAVLKEINFPTNALCKPTYYSLSNHNVDSIVQILEINKEQKIYAGSVFKYSPKNFIIKHVIQNTLISYYLFKNFFKTQSNDKFDFTVDDKFLFILKDKKILHTIPYQNNEEWDLFNHYSYSPASYVPLQKHIELKRPSFPIQILCIPGIKIHEWYALDFNKKTFLPTGYSPGINMPLKDITIQFSK